MLGNNRLRNQIFRIISAVICIRRALRGHNHFVSDIVISSDGQFALSGLETICNVL